MNAEQQRPQATVIIRAKNEERWIGSCLKAVVEQEFSDFEVIVVNNQSSDGTAKKAGQFPVRVLETAGDRPGQILNQAIAACDSPFLVFLSAHCIPVNNQWLANLLAPFEDARVAGVYGRQQPMTFSSSQAKRDLTITFGLDRRVQEKDPFFHNANSAIRREVWLQSPFDESATNIEDRLWAEAALGKGYCLVYEPAASVYHHHGIHHDNAPVRMRQTVQVLERFFQDENGDYALGQIRPEERNVLAMIPIARLRDQAPGAREAAVLDLTIQAAKNSRHINRTMVFTDDEATARVAEGLGAEIPFLRDRAYSADHVNLSTVYAYCLQELEERGDTPDLVVCLEPTYPFRPPKLLDTLITSLLRGGYDSVLAARQEHNPIWLLEGDEPRRLDDGDVPRQYKEPILVGLKGLGCVTHPDLIRQGKLLGEKVGLVPVQEPLAHLEVRSAEHAAELQDIILLRGKKNGRRG